MVHAKRVTIFIGLILFSSCAFAQSFELVRPADFRYYITVDSDTVATRSLDYKAYQDAIYYQCQNPDALVRVEPVGVEARGCPVPEPEDIVRQYNNDYSLADSTGHVWPETIRNLNLSIRVVIADTTGSYAMAVSGFTSSEYIRVATNCYGPDPYGELINERVSGRADTLTDGFVKWERDGLQCRGMLTYWITDSAGDLSVQFADIGQILSLN